MGQLANRLGRTPVLGPMLVFGYRLRSALRFLAEQSGRVLHWLFSSRETTNFTYALDPVNRRYLAAQVADIVDIDFEIALGYVDELDQDAELRRHIETATLRSPLAFKADRVAHYGKRAVWYALARATKPGLVVETGVDKGLGACVLTAALLRNAREGHPGRYLGTDINPEAGYLLAGDYASVGRVLYGDSAVSLRTIQGPIDLMINDSSRSAADEAEEYALIEPKLGTRAIVMSDNALGRDTLLQFALRTGRRFVFFQERPASHWYAGSGVGIAFRR